ncbi:MAG TPA: MMPL family transporter, partial [Gaiellaceae bacterium]|nr:MMPL family transporter [Gaiellaceae bacterium]
MTAFARIVSGRRSKFVVLAAWVVTLVALGPLIGQFESKQKNEPSSFLPEAAESVRALELSDQVASAEGVAAIAIFSRAGGLTAADREAIAGIRDELDGSRPDGVVSVSPPQPSEDGEAVLVVTQIVADGDETILIDAVDAVREELARVPEGLEAKVTGPAGYSADASAAFEGINSTLLLATSALVFVLLVLIYRSPIFWVLPLLAVFFAEAMVRGIGSLLVDAGVVVNGQTGGILLVLVFGAGTDYALLLTARYREELHRHEDKHEAMRVAVRQAGPGILASAGTV